MMDEILDMSSGDLIELRGERVDGLVVGRFAAEGAHDFGCGAEAPDGVQGDDSRVLQVEQAGIGILVEEAVEDLALARSPYSVK